MTPTKQTTRDTLREIVAAFCDHPEAIEIISQEAPGACYWALRVHPEDESKAIGKGGSHVRALQLLVKRFGEAEGEDHTLRLVTTTEPRERPIKHAIAAMQFDPRPAKELLDRILCQLPIEKFWSHVGPGEGPRNALTFRFAIKIANEKDGRFLCGTSSGEETLIGALGTLFRAIAKKNGVRFDLTVNRVSES